MFVYLLTITIYSVIAASETQILGKFELKEGPTAHALTSNPIELVDTHTIRIPNLYYDGTGPDAYWIIGKGPVPAERPPDAPGVKIPNEKGSCQVLSAYRSETIELVLPSSVTVNDIDWLAMYCFQYKHTFGWVDFASVRKQDGNRFRNVPEAPPTLNVPKPCAQAKFPESQGSGSALFPQGLFPIVFLNWLAAPFHRN